jgi:MoaA/NifB/PqqE/SkfB family radical SAM enzyme
MDLIWNISLICPWDCEFCCTDAVHVKRNGSSAILREAGLSETRLVPMRREGLIHLNVLEIAPNVYDYALSDRQQRGLELTLSQKLEVIKNIDIDGAMIDFAGGDPLACLENFLVISAAKERFGKNQISVTSTGHSIARYNLADLVDNIGTYEFTFDEPSTSAATCRPNGYNKLNLNWAKKIGSMGVKTKCQIPIHKGNISISKIADIYKELSYAGIDEVLLMRTFPVGRGMKFMQSQPLPNASEYRMVIEKFRELEEKYTGTRVKIQCALKHLYSNDEVRNPCDLMHSSYGINSKGTLLLSAWATNAVGNPLSDDFVLGDLSKNTLSHLSRTDKAQEYRKKLDENFGHCKIFAYTHSNIKSSDAIFMKADPLYS